MQKRGEVRNKSGNFFFSSSLFYVVSLLLPSTMLFTIVSIFFSLFLQKKLHYFTSTMYIIEDIWAFDKLARNVAHTWLFSTCTHTRRKNVLFFSVDVKKYKRRLFPNTWTTTFTRKSGICFCPAILVVGGPSCRMSPVCLKRTCKQREWKWKKARKGDGESNSW